MKILLLLISTLLVVKAQAQLEIDPRVQKLEVEVRNTVDQTMQTLLGPHSKYIMSVQATPIRQIASDPEESNEIDLGYLPFPTDYLATGTGNGAPAKLRIGSMRVAVQLPNTLEANAVDEVRSTLRTVLAKYRPAISVIQKAFPTPVADPNRKPAQEEKPEEAKKEEPEPSFFEKYEKMIRMGLTLLAILAGIGLLIYFAKAMRGGLESLAAGLRAAGKSTEMKGNEDQPLNLKHHNEMGDGPGKGPSEAVTLSTDDIDNMVAKVREMLLKYPMLFASCIEDTEEEARGLRWLVTQLDEHERNDFKATVPPMMVQKLQQIQIDGKFQPGPWVQDFAERITLSQIRGESMVAQALTPDEMQDVANFDGEKLCEQVLNQSNGGLWRLFIETRSTEELKSLLRTLPHEKWAEVLLSVTSTKEEIKASFDSVKSQVMATTESEGGEDLNFFSTTLLNPLVEMIKEKKPGEDDRLISSLRNKNAKLADELAKYVWTPSRLEGVADSSLQEVVQQLSNEQLFSLILTLPEPWSQKVESLLREGRQKIIVMDLVNEAKSNPNEKGEQAAIQVTRDFLDYLQTLDNQGQLARGA